MKKLFSVLKEVEIYLNKYPLLRDNDDRLMANIWAKYIGSRDDMDGPESWKDMLSLLAKGKLPSYESISRCRRKIQEKNPHLRGEKWNERHGRAKEIRREIAR